MPAKTVYKICRQAEWHSAEAAGVCEGAEIDLVDGFVHFSTATQVAETLARHFAGATGCFWSPSRRPNWVRP